MPRAPKPPLPVVGWREWLLLDDLCPTALKVKIDTGARTSALHAFRLKITEVDGIAHATFVIHPRQRTTRDSVTVTVPVKEFKEIRSSNGKVEKRPVIRTTALLGETRWPIDLTLTSREEMGFRMLLGRAAVSRRFLVNPGSSYVQTPKKGPTP